MTENPAAERALRGLDPATIETLTEVRDAVADQLRKHPIAAVAAGVAVGLLLARVLRGR